jgi:rhamnosyl/mannosyltransferase
MQISDMRVAHFAKYAFARIGGMERHVGILTRALAARGVDVTVFAYDPSGTAKPRMVDGVKVEPVPTLLHFSSQSLAPALITRSRGIARERRFDVVHQHWPDPFAHIAATLVPGRPAHVVSWHSDIVRQKLLRPIYRAIAPRVLARPDALIGATQAHLRSAQMDCFAPPERRHVIPYSIDTSPFEVTPRVTREAQALRMKYGCGPLIFALGRHVYYKGFEVLIRAMARVPAVLLLGGEGPLTPQLRELATSVGAKVEFVGTISEPMLPVYYHASNVFCLPSVAQTEAFGLVQAEAMACGKPLVNTALGNGVNELAPHDVCALTVSPGDERALAEALTHMLLDTNLSQRLGSAGFERVRAHFTVDVMVRQMLDLYHELISRL